jgi:2-polyprenyl-3-methyl-5-hydroxy-6-metoxy-1,4-benzoquinol methylase
VPDGVVLWDGSVRYLTSTGAASMVDLVAVANGPQANWPHLAETVRTGVVPNPVELDPVAFYRPLVEATFPTQHRAALRLGARLGWSRRPGLRVLDLGAGGAPWALAVLLSSTGSTAVVNDLPGVVELAAEKASALGAADRIIVRAGNYHEIEIEPAAYDVVMVCHVLRAEGATGARALIERAARALRPGGTLVAADYARGATRTTNPFAALMGATLAASTREGTTFTGPELVGWLHATGLRDIRFHEPIGGQYAYTAEQP